MRFSSQQMFGLLTQCFLISFFLRVNLVFLDCLDIQEDKVLR